ncbi:hypothetical protein EMGBS15_16620 [Filimonas sp.]|jgi:hypothetical protein|nr:hypothetical protein EMGBS15_16620 [Filimonas sp.]
MLSHLTQSASFTLLQLLEVIKRTDDFQYRSSLPILFGSTLGMHVRHIVEFYQCVLRCDEEGFINYDARLRNLQIENDTAYAGSAINECLTGMQHLTDDKPLILLTSQDMSDQTIQIKTNILRELTYLIEHSIHHMAILKMAYTENFPSVKMPEHFGVAYSTLKHHQLVHSNLSAG